MGCTNSKGRACSSWSVDDDEERKARKRRRREKRRAAKEAGAANTNTKRAPTDEATGKSSASPTTISGDTHVTFSSSAKKTSIGRGRDDDSDDDDDGDTAGVLGSHTHTASVTLSTGSSASPSPSSGGSGSGGGGGGMGLAFEAGGGRGDGYQVIEEGKNHGARLPPSSDRVPKNATDDMEFDVPVITLPDPAKPSIAPKPAHSALCQLAEKSNYKGVQGILLLLQAQNVVTPGTGRADVLNMQTEWIPRYPADFTPLMAAAVGGNVEIARLMLHERALPDLKDHSGANALLYACKHNHVPIVRLLLEPPVRARVTHLVTIETKRNPELNALVLQALTREQASPAPVGSSLASRTSLLRPRQASASAPSASSSSSSGSVTMGHPAPGILLSPAPSPPLTPFGALPLAPSSSSSAGSTASGSSDRGFESGSSGARGSATSGSTPPGLSPAALAYLAPPSALTISTASPRGGRYVSASPAPVGAR